MDSTDQEHDGSVRGDFEWLFSFPAQNSQSSSEVEGDWSGVVTFETAQLMESLRRTSSNQAPRPDGLPPEFYFTFFDELRIFLMVFNAAQDLSVVPESTSLLNGDYKLFTKYLNKHFIQQHLKKCTLFSEGTINA